jgi:hypothetical protein
MYPLRFDAHGSPHFAVGILVFIYIYILTLSRTNSVLLNCGHLSKIARYGLWRFTERTALSATAVSRQGRIYRKTLYGDFCRYES